MLGGLTPTGGVCHQVLEHESDLATTFLRVNGEGDSGVVNVQIFGGRTHSFTHRRRVTHGQRQSAEDANVLSFGQAQAEVGAAQVNGGVPQ